MKRSGFTMIELIFVIVILGILAAVALPKFIGVSEQAQAGKVAAYVGTLNRTVAPALWSASVADGTHNGSVTHIATADLEKQIETPKNIGDTGLDLTIPAGLTTCTPNAAGTLSSPATDAELTGLASVGSVTIGGVAYTIRCYDGSMTEAPRFVLSKTDATLGEVVVVK